MKQWSWGSWVNAVKHVSAGGFQRCLKGQLRMIGDFQMQWGWPQLRTPGSGRETTRVVARHCSFLLLSLSYIDMLTSILLDKAEEPLRHVRCAALFCSLRAVVMLRFFGLLDWGLSNWPLSLMGSGIMFL